MTKQRFSASAYGESRILCLFKELGPNVKTWGNDVGSTYIAQGFKEKDPIKQVTGIPMAVGSALFELPDYLWAGAVDEKLNNAEDIRTWRDIKAIGRNNVRHPIRTVLSGLRLISDVPMDVGDKLFGFKHRSSVASLQHRSYERMQNTLQHPN